MNKLKNIYNNSLVRLGTLILLAVLVFLIIQLFSNSNTTLIDNSSNYCKASDKNSGVIRLNTYISSTSKYNIWVHIETPVQLNYEVTSDIYNPLLLNIDNKNCYKLGGNNISLNSWVWINNLYTTPNQDFNVNLIRGNHSFAFSSNYTNIDRVLLISNGCTPVGSGSNCDASTNSDVNIPD